MNQADAIALIDDAVGARGPNEVWADLGAGEGTFTRALATKLGPGSRIVAVDRDKTAIETLEILASRMENVLPVHADITRPFVLPELAESSLHGLIAANSLHFVPDIEVTLSRLVKLVRVGGRVVIVEYDRRAPSRWVPYPLSIADLTRLAPRAGLSTPVVTATSKSRYQGELYAARADRLT